MAEAFEIAGPTDVTLTPQGGGVNALGRTDGQELISLDVRVHGREVFSDEGGMVPQEVIHLGMTGLLTMQLVKWDRAILQELWNTAPRSALSGDAHLNQGDVGRLWSSTSVTDVGFFALAVTPDLTDSRTVYTFNKCYLLGDDAIREADVGNGATVLRLSINVLPDSNNDLYAKTVTS